MSRRIRTLCWLGCAAALAACSKGGVADDENRPDLAQGPDLAERRDLAMRTARVLDTPTGCSMSLYSNVSLVDEFDSAVELDKNWNWKNDGRFPTPKLAGGALSFGPYNLKQDEWWNNYSPVASLSTFGDVLLCVRLRIKPGLANDDSSMELSLRGQSGGMALQVQGGAQQVALSTKRGENDWVGHASRPLAMKAGDESSLEVLLSAVGNHYVAEVRSLQTGELVAMKVDSALPADGVVGMLGWRLPNTLYVDRLVVGTPTVEVARTLAAE